MPMTEEDICRDIANLHDNIYAAGVIENQRLVARYTKLDDPPVSEEQLRLMFAQPEVQLSIAKTAEKFFGNIRYLIACFETSDFLYFPAIIDRKDKILYVRMKRTYRGEEILKKVYDYLGKREK